MNTQTRQISESSTASGSVPPGGYRSVVAGEGGLLRLVSDEDSDGRALIRRIRETHSPHRLDELKDELFSLGVSAVPGLREAIESHAEDGATRAALLEVLAAIDVRNARPILLRACSDHDPRVREAAVEALGSGPLDDESRRILDRMSQEDASPVVKEKAREILDD